MAKPKRKVVKKKKFKKFLRLEVTDRHFKYSEEHVAKWEVILWATYSKTQASWHGITIQPELESKELAYDLAKSIGEIYRQEGWDYIIDVDTHDKRMAEAKRERDAV